MGRSVHLSDNIIVQTKTAFGQFGPGFNAGAGVNNIKSIEFFNEDLDASAPSDLMITQTIVADADGVFSYVTPGAGWWGFAALNTAPETIAHDGAERAVELGAVIWVHFEEWTAE